MRTLVILLVSLMATLSGYSQFGKKYKEDQSNKFGIKVAGGVISPRSEITYIGNSKDQVIHQVELAGASPQFAAGLWGQKRFGWLYAEGNMMVSRYNMNFNVTTFAEEGQPLKYLTETFTYGDIQVMGGLISNGFRIGVGPVMHILLNHKSDLTKLGNFNQKLRDVSYGFSGAVGYDWNRVSFDLRYDKAFRTVGDHIYYGNKKSLFLETPDAITLSVAFVLVK
jgi:hypothetical protein